MGRSPAHRHPAVHGPHRPSTRTPRLLPTRRRSHPHLQHFCAARHRTVRSQALRRGQSSPQPPRHRLGPGRWHPGACGSTSSLPAPSSSKAAAGPGGGTPTPTTTRVCGPASRSVGSAAPRKSPGRSRSSPARPRASSPAPTWWSTAVSWTASKPASGLHRFNSRRPKRPQAPGSPHSLTPRGGAAPAGLPGRRQEHRAPPSQARPRPR